MRAPVFLTGILLLSACAGDTRAPSGNGDIHSLTAAAMDSLPVLSILDGSLICTADGYDNCPLRSAFVNRLDRDRVALWEPGRSVQTIRRGDTTLALLGSYGSGTDQYAVVGAVRASGSQFDVLVLDVQPILVHFGSNRQVTRRDTLPFLDPETALGYVGSQAVKQVISGWASDSGAMLNVHLLDDIRDNSGTVVLRAPIPWMRGEDPNESPLPPLIASIPVYALVESGGVVWSPGSTMTVESRSARGAVQWRVEGPPGPPVTTAHLDRRVAEVRESAPSLPLDSLDFAGMRARADSVHPAVTGIVLSSTGEVFVALASVPTRDSVPWLRLAANGTPMSRFQLSRQTRVLLADGDSLLVHRPTEGEPWEVRWLNLRATP